MTISILNTNDVISNLKKSHSYFNNYFAFYSSWYDGITTDPYLMLLPLDDHMVHRGDGVFEAIKAVNRRIYLFDEHLERLFLSANKIDLYTPYTHERIKEIVIATLQAANQDNVAIRVFLSRGPGNFSVNPYDSIGTQLYVAITSLLKLPEEKYQQGVKIGISHIPIKTTWLTQVKSCNYLPNVLMKKEAIDRHLDFVIGVNEEENITESATENILIVDNNNTIVYPCLDKVLKGTTMIRLCELAERAGMKNEGREISVKDLLNANEVFMTGTTLDVMPVTQFEDRKIADGKPGPIAKKLRNLIVDDINNGDKSTNF